MIEKWLAEYQILKKEDLEQKAWAKNRSKPPPPPKFGTKSNTYQNYELFKKVFIRWAEKMEDPYDIAEAFALAFEDSEQARVAQQKINEIWSNLDGFVENHLPKLFEMVDMRTLDGHLVCRAMDGIIDFKVKQGESDVKALHRFKELMYMAKLRADDDHVLLKRCFFKAMSGRGQAEVLLRKGTPDPYKLKWDVIEAVCHFTTFQNMQT
uniref:Uncharacterized protein n=1 Tax=Palpitomonas bilix TaxID=652834 RepID=A0A7S3D5T0_9EUKA|mmetsp:Transcript_23505/g.59367  ORF Transcript_23505/g.59367 Transcript_23505/m.59367 type:complete len:209 (+) Transcript_23505:166-792(+)